MRYDSIEEVRAVVLAINSIGINSNVKNKKINKNKELNLQKVMQLTSGYSVAIKIKTPKNTFTQFSLCPLRTFVRVLHVQFVCRPKDNTKPVHYRP
jgi:hypothetical protein